MVLKKQVVESFEALGLTTEAEYSVAARTYKRLAFEHHPDRNHDRATEATAKFQEVRRYRHVRGTTDVIAD